MRQVCSMFSQMLQLIPRDQFAEAVRQHGAERHARGFTCWGQFVAMLFCHLGQAHSLREICSGLACSEGKLRHLGIPVAPNRSTLAYANEHRSWQVYETVFMQLQERTQQQHLPRKFRFKNPLKIIDSSLIDLCEQMFPWAQYCRGKGAAKLHMVLDGHTHLPHYAHITEGRASDLAEARKLRWQPGTILVMDRAYLDYEWFQNMCDDGVFFVTRSRSYFHYEVLQDRAVPAGGVIVRDQVVRLGSPTWHTRMHSPVRRIEVTRPGQENLVILSNHLNFSPKTIADIYRERWKIETFFRTLKQTMRVKTFVGTTANALKIQIWTALIALLLLKFLQIRSRLSWSLSMLVALLRQQLFVYRDLWLWLEQPWQPPEPPLTPQLLLLPQPI